MPRNIIGCPGYYLADDNKTILDANGKAVGNKREYFTIILDGTKHNVQRAKLAWCALNDVNPFDVSDEYIFYYINGVPRKRKTAAITSHVGLSDIAFQKKLKSWAEKQGFYDQQKYVETMHRFIEKHNVSLNERDDENDYIVVKKTNKINDDINKILSIYAEYNDYGDFYINKETREIIKSYAEKRDMTIWDFIEKYSWLLSLPENLDNDLLDEVKEEAESKKENLWEYLVGLHCQNGCLDDKINIAENKIKELEKENESLKEQLAKLKADAKTGDVQGISTTDRPVPETSEMIQTIFFPLANIDEIQKCAETLHLTVFEYLIQAHEHFKDLHNSENDSKQPSKTDDMKTKDIALWKAVGIQMCYCNENIKDDKDDSFFIRIIHDDEEDKNYVAFKNIDKVNVSVDEVINLIKDAEQRLTMSNPTTNNT